MSDQQPTEHPTLPTTYTSGQIENKWYKTWEENKCFAPRPGKTNKSYCVIMPPPNVTGKLHAGHALDVTTQDALIRFKRMKGFETLWLPGMDHAGIATQNVVEQMVYREEGKRRDEYQRQEFVKKIWAWKEQYGGEILNQQKVLGASPDWEYSKFTMDASSNEAVRTAFVKLYDEGLIYQSDYIVNWDPVLKSAISDAEVEHQEVKGSFYHIYYRIKDSDQLLEIATTRPETLLGDTAVAVNPNDERFKDLIGKTAIVPICNREVPIIGDDYVDLEKGTGCLKVTPGHDFNDFEIGRRHQLEIVNILNRDGTLNQQGLDFQGLSCIDARKKVVKKLKELALFVKEERHTHMVGHGDRSHAIIEPMVSKQWFMKMDEMAKMALETIEKDETRFYPQSWENTYFSWLRNIKDWCISRQLWWGHQIPVFTCEDCQHQWATIDLDPPACPKCAQTKIVQDPDVLDTWFSSGLWPFSTLGWPDPERMKERKFDTFFPTSTLVTGFDIIFFWVARMVMMSKKITGKSPFEKIYIHAIVRDKQGRKMSKSLNNGIDPLEMCDRYGADAFRFTLAAGSGHNRGLNLDPERIGGYRNFINKIWNAYRFIAPFMPQAQAELPAATELDHQEKWIISELNSTADLMNRSIEEFRYDDSCSAIYAFVYHKFCSWFIELSKNILHGDDEARKKRRAAVLKWSFKKILALLHPFTPFITEELWSYLQEEQDPFLILADYPEFADQYVYAEDQAQINKFIEVVTNIRNLRASVQIKPREQIALQLFAREQNVRDYFQKAAPFLQDLAGISTITTKDTELERPKKSIMAVTPFCEIFIPLEGVINIDEQIGRLKRDIAKAEKEFAKYHKKLSNEKFIANAKAEVVVEVKEKAQELDVKLAALRKSLENFS